MGSQAYLFGYRISKCTVLRMETVLKTEPARVGLNFLQKPPIMVTPSDKYMQMPLIEMLIAPNYPHRWSPLSLFHVEETPGALDDVTAAQYSRGDRGHQISGEHFGPIHSRLDYHFQLNNIERCTMGRQLALPIPVPPTVIAIYKHLQVNSHRSLPRRLFVYFANGTLRRKRSCDGNRCSVFGPVPLWLDVFGLHVFLGSFLPVRNVKRVFSPT